jgi:hypothetical protein
MIEDYLHYIWKFGLFNKIELKTEDCEALEILNLGIHNFDSGPDFLQAQISIDNIKWFGNVEIHVNTSDWDKHKHQLDKAYNNVILHVVYNHDKEIYNQRAELIPTVELKDLLGHEHYFGYERFIYNQKWIPCEKLISTISQMKINAWLDRMLLERLERKSLAIEKELRLTNGDWDEVFYRFIFRYFGMKVNGNPMMDLARRTPLKLLQKESKSCFTLEALLFGQSGILDDDLKDEYFSKLKEEYLFQKQKYGLVSMDNVQWRYSKLRPPNFPSIRIGQLAMLYSSNSSFFQLIRNMESLGKIKEIFKTSTSSYWKNHYVFGKYSENTKNTAGKMLLDNILINTVVPVCFAYGKAISDQSYIDYAITLLKEVQPEINKITTKWSSLGIPIHSAFDSQALIELYGNYCSKKKCLNCNLGVALLNK